MPRRDVLAAVVPRLVARVDEKPTLRVRKTSLGHTTKNYVGGIISVFEADGVTPRRRTYWPRDMCKKIKLRHVCLYEITLCSVDYLCYRKRVGRLVFRNAQYGISRLQRPIRHELVYGQVVSEHVTVFRQHVVERRVQLIRDDRVVPLNHTPYITRALRYQTRTVFETNARLVASHSSRRFCNFFILTRICRFER